MDTALATLPTESLVSILPAECLINILPTECLVSILLQGSLEALGRTARTCADCRSAALDVGLWRALLATVWLADAGAEAAAAAGQTTATPTPRSDFLRRFHLHSRLHQMRLWHGNFLLPSRSYLTMSMQYGGVQQYFNRDYPQVQQFAYNGTAEEVEDHDTVGTACLPGPLESWPVGRGGQVQYFEVNILDGGSHQYIAVGWCRREYPERYKQPGWEKHTYGYHGDDGRAYAGSGFGKRYGPTFGKVRLGNGNEPYAIGDDSVVGPNGLIAGTVVGTGLLWSADGASCSIFYTLDGVNLGIAFERVPRPGLLRPCVGLHSPGETVRLNFGFGPTELTRRSPPKPPTPFAFDLNGFLASCSRMRERFGGGEGGSGGERRHHLLSPGDGGEGEENEGEEEEGEEEEGEMDEVGDVGSEEGEDSLVEIRKLVAQEDDLSEEDIEELRYYLRSRGLGDVDLHPSWGAEDVAGLAADSLRALCAQVLLEEEEFEEGEGGEEGGKGDYDDDDDDDDEEGEDEENDIII